MLWVGVTSRIVEPIWAGDMVTRTPASFRAWIFSSAPPLPPEMMAPAWPILLPGGAVNPAMKEATGLALGPWVDIDKTWDVFLTVKKALHEIVKWNCLHRAKLPGSQCRSRSGLRNFVSCKHSIWIVIWIISWNILYTHFNDRQQYCKETS